MWIGGQEYDLEYGYDLAGQLVSERYPSGRVVTNSYDANGRLAGVADGSRTYLSNLQFQGLGGSLSSMSYGNGTVQTFGLNDRMQMISQELKRGTETLQKYAYGYGQLNASGTLDTTKNNGQLSQIESWIGTAKQWTQKFNYDDVGRLKQSAEYKGTDGSLTYRQVFDFDRFGNMYRKAASNPSTGQANPLPFTQIEESDISKATNRFTTGTTYDEAGNVASDAKFRGMGFGYDANGRMVKATKANVPDALSVYDAAGMRVAERVNDVWRFSVYDIGGKIVAEYGGVPATDEGGVKYLLSDWQGSNRAVLSNTGNVLGRVDYTAYGEEIQAGVGLRTATQGFDNSTDLRQKYGLTERDSATGLDHTWFRKNEGRAGRWTSPDPYNGSISLGNPQSFNRYSYVQNDPVNFIDPSGLDPSSPGTTYTYGIVWTVWHWTNANGWQMVGHWYEPLGSGTLGSDATALARDAFNAFTQANRACLELAKKLGLKKGVENATYTLPDEKDLGSKLSALGFEAGDIGVASGIFATLTLADLQPSAVAVTNPHTQTTYLFNTAFPSGVGDINDFKIKLGRVIFHEALHLNGDDHEKIAKALKLSYDTTIADEEKRDAAASNALDKFIEAGCKKEDKK